MFNKEKVKQIQMWLSGLMRTWEIYSAGLLVSNHQKALSTEVNRLMEQIIRSGKKNN